MNGVNPMGPRYSGQVSTSFLFTCDEYKIFPEPRVGSVVHLTTKAPLWPGTLISRNGKLLRKGIAAQFMSTTGEVLVVPPPGSFAVRDVPQPVCHLEWCVGSAACQIRFNGRNMILAMEGPRLRPLTLILVFIFDGSLPL